MRLRYLKPYMGPRRFWYVHGTWDNRWYTRGPFTSDSEARAMGLQMFPQGANWDVYELPTRDLSRAKRMLAERGLSMGLDLKEVTKPKYTKRKPEPESIK